MRGIVDFFVVRVVLFIVVNNVVSNFVDFVGVVVFIFFIDVDCVVCFIEIYCEFFGIEVVWFIFFGFYVVCNVVSVFCFEVFVFECSEF